MKTKDTALQNFTAETSCLNLALQDIINFKELASGGVTNKWFVASQYCAAIWDTFAAFYQTAGELTSWQIQKQLGMIYNGGQAAEAIKFFNDEIVGRTIPQSQLQDYYIALREARLRRMTKDKALKLLAMSEDATATSEGLKAYDSESATDMIAETSSITLKSSAEIAEAATDFYKERLVDKGKNIKIELWLPTLNVIFGGGLTRGEWIACTGATGAGKSQFFQELMVQTTRAGSIGLAVSLEMNATAWLGRVIQQDTGISKSKMDMGNFDKQQTQVFGSLKRIGQQKLYMLDSRMTTTNAIQASIERIIAKEGRIDLVGIDYVQLLKDKRLKGESETERHDRISTFLQMLPDIYNCSLFTILRLNRDGKINGSSQYEHDASTNMHIENESLTKKTDNLDDKYGPCSLLFSKNRYGITGEFVFQYNPYHLRLTEPGDVLPKPNFYKAEV